jgi:hypothetical protein
MADVHYMYMSVPMEIFRKHLAFMQNVTQSAELNATKLDQQLDEFGSFASSFNAF